MFILTYPTKTRPCWSQKSITPFKTNDGAETSCKCLKCQVHTRVPTNMHLSLAVLTTSFNPHLAFSELFSQICSDTKVCTRLPWRYFTSPCLQLPKQTSFIQAIWRGEEGPDAAILWSCCFIKKAHQICTGDRSNNTHTDTHRAR